MAGTRQFYDYRTPLAERIEEISLVTCDAKGTESTEWALDRLKRGNLDPVVAYRVMFGDKNVEIQTAPHGFAKSYITWELILVSKKATDNMQDAMDGMFQKLHHYAFPVDNELEISVDRALTCYFEGWDEVITINDDLKYAIATIKIVTFDELV